MFKLRCIKAGEKVRINKSGKDIPNHPNISKKSEDDT